MFDAEFFGTEFFDSFYSLLIPMTDVLSSFRVGWNTSAFSTSPGPSQGVRQVVLVCADWPATKASALDKRR